MKIIYPAIIEQTDGQYLLSFPDLPGCRTWGETPEDVVSFAPEAPEGYVLACLEHNIPLQAPCRLSDLPAPDKTYVCIDADAASLQRVKKTLTIPAWVNRIGVEENINFSKALTDAILARHRDRLTKNV